MTPAFYAEIVSFYFGGYMLVNIAIILLLGMIFGKIFQKIGIAPILGMLIVGIVISPNQLGLVDQSIYQVSPTLRQIALVVILSRAGLSLDFDRLKTVGKSAILLSFIPASIEMLALIFLGHLIFDLPYLDSGLLASVLAAVSPAIVVPRMIKLMDEGYGADKAIPEMILSAASVDDVFVIVFFSSFLALKTGGDTSFMSFFNIPISIALGIVLGLVVGKILANIFKKINLSPVYKSIMYLSMAFLMLGLEDLLKPYIAISGLIAIMVIGMAINRFASKESKEVLSVYNGLWEVFEILLFVLVGIALDLAYVKKAGILALLLIILGLVFRMLGVQIALSGSNLNKKEKLFTSYAYLPKATVQAAIGPVPLAMGLANGELILSIAVLAILLTAPLGAILTDKTYEKYLVKDNSK